MTAWLLIFSISNSSGSFISNIRDEEACKLLSTEIRKAYFYLKPELRCVPYPLAVSTLPPEKAE